MTIAIAVGAWMIASLLLGLLLGRVFRLAAKRSQVEEGFLPLLERKAPPNDRPPEAPKTSSLHFKIFSESL